MLSFLELHLNRSFVQDEYFFILNSSVRRLGNMFLSNFDVDLNEWNVYFVVYVRTDPMRVDWTRR